VEPTPFLLPRLGGLLRHAAPRIFEDAIAPVAVFLLALHFLGVYGAIIAGLGFVYTMIGWRLVTRRPVHGILVLSALSLTVRSVLALASGSIFVYFLQPTLGTALVATIFLVSAHAGRPLAGRVARDFCPIPDHVATTGPMHRFFTQITVLWAVSFALNSAVALWLLLSQSVGVFVVTRTVASLTLTALAVAISLVWFRRSMGDHVAFAPRPTAG
jgi:intracellular septation protein A